MRQLRCQRVAFLGGGGQLRGDAGKLGSEIGSGLAFDIQQLAKIEDLRAHVIHRRVLSGHTVGEIDLNQHKDQQDEDDHHQQCRQRVDKARPGVVFGTAGTAKTRQRHAQDPFVWRVERPPAALLTALARVRSSAATALLARLRSS